MNETPGQHVEKCIDELDLVIQYLDIVLRAVCEGSPDDGKIDVDEVSNMVLGAATLAKYQKAELRMWFKELKRTKAF